MDHATTSATAAGADQHAITPPERHRSEPALRSAIVAALRPIIEALGIKVVYWQDRGLGDGDRGLEPGEALAPSHQPPTPSLRWTVRERALGQGVTSVRRLSFRTRKSRDVLARFEQAPQHQRNHLRQRV